MSEPDVPPGGAETARVRLDRFSAEGFDRGASRLMEALWVGVGGPILRCFVPGSGWRVRLLRLFCARIGKGTVWKPGVRVKFPWRLSVGDHCWLGEDVWIDNLAQISLADHVCVSQGAYLCTGNHDWSIESFDLIVEGITLETGVWIGAKTIIGPGTHFEEGAVLTAGSVAVGHKKRYTIYGGNTAVPIAQRQVSPSSDD